MPRAVSWRTAAWGTCQEEAEEEEPMEEKEWLERWKETGGQTVVPREPKGSKGIGLKVSKSPQALRNSTMSWIQEV